jgi:esterase/lipase superfamily enzyme
MKFAPRKLSRKALGALVSVLLIGLGIAVFSQIQILPPAKDDTVGVVDWLVVPVFYATNRTYAGDGKSIEYSQIKNGQSLLFGVKNVLVPFPDAPTLSEQKLQMMGWQRLHTDTPGQKPTVSLEACTVKDQLLGQKEVVEAFDAYSDKTQTQESCVFVHGCCATFDSSMNRSAKIAAYMQIPLVLYDWESPVGFQRYLQNETRVQQTCDNFCNFLNSIEQIRDPSEITLLGHSMGAMFVDQAMVRRASNRKMQMVKPYREIIMSNADIDAQSFVNHANEFAENANTVRIYVSRKDDRLDASSFAHGGFERLGAPGPLLGELRKLSHLDIIDITAGDTGHEIPFSLVSAVHDEQEPKLEGGLYLDKIQPNYWTLSKH